MTIKIDGKVDILKVKCDRIGREEEKERKRVESERKKSMQKRDIEREIE